MYKNLLKYVNFRAETFVIVGRRCGVSSCQLRRGVRRDGRDAVKWEVNNACLVLPHVRHGLSLQRSVEAATTPPSEPAVSAPLFRGCGAKNSHWRCLFSLLVGCVEGARSAAAPEAS